MTEQRCICDTKFIMPRPGKSAAVFRRGESLAGEAAAFAIEYGFAHAIPTPAAPSSAAGQELKESPSAASSQTPGDASNDSASDALVAAATAAGAEVRITRRK